MSRFLHILSKKLDDDKIAILAWCLMENHFHLLVKADQPALSQFMQRVTISYAQYFNGRHGHVGKVFQNRFHSTDINSESHLLSVVRYIHRNALEAGSGSISDWEWSSYRECIGDDDAVGTRICDVEQTLALFGSKDDFVAFHQDEAVQEDIVSILPYRSRISDAEARRIIEERIGKNYADMLSSTTSQERNERIRMLKHLGLSIRQIERLTGIGRGIITRA